MKTLGERRKEIELLMEYAVPKEHFAVASALVDKYEADPIALNLFFSFYSFLPDAQDDAITELRLLARKSGVFLLCAGTLMSVGYLYAVDYTRAEFLGGFAEGIWDEEVLAFFGFVDRGDFIEKHKKNVNSKVYLPAHQDIGLCPVCFAATGEYHILGCPVEVCPWCGGQLTRCNCRFTKLGLPRIDKERHIGILHNKINEKGRIPYDAMRHRPSRPSLEEEGGDQEK